MNNLTLRRHAQRIYLIGIWQECVSLFNAETGSRLVPGRADLRDFGDLNAEISHAGGRPQVTVNGEFLDLLDILNQCALALGCQLLTRGDVNYDLAQLAFDAALRVTLKVSPRGMDPLATYLADRLRRDRDYGAYYKGAAQHWKLRRESRLAAIALDEKKAAWELIPLVYAFDGDMGRRFSDLQLRFLMLHELGHYHSGHLETAMKKRQEHEADLLGANVFFWHLKKSASGAHAQLGAAPVLALFLHMGFVEDLLRLSVRLTKFAMKEDFRPMFIEAKGTHPQAFRRVRELLEAYREQFDPDSCHIATVMETGVICIKDCIELGLIDLKNFKHCCRARALEQTHRAVASLITDRDAKETFMDKLDYDMLTNGTAAT